VQPRTQALRSDARTSLESLGTRLVFVFKIRVDSGGIGLPVDRFDSYNRPLPSRCESTPQFPAPSSDSV
jgi:hypothetical protein